LNSQLLIQERRLRRHEFPRERGYRGDCRAINGARGYLFEMIDMARLSPREGISLGIHFREREGTEEIPGYRTAFARFYDLVSAC
jgi:hypothetical protein